METAINPSHVVEALCTIHLHGASPQQIHIANNYLSQCQSKPQFPSLLLEIYSQTDNHQLQLSSLLLFTNVVKRNWSNRGKASLNTGLDKQAIKAAIVKSCVIHNMKHYKHFNALLKTVTRNCYPNNYPQLHQFILSSLQNMIGMAESTPDSFLTHPFAGPVLSVVKGVIKQYSSKRIGHNQQDFKQFIAPVVGKGIQLSVAVQKILKQGFTQANTEKVVTALQHLRKADKITMYALISMPTAYQSQTEIAEMIRNVVVKLKQYDDILGLANLHHNIREQLQKYEIGILELITKTQNAYPFLFSQFLKDYLTLLLGMLLVQAPQPGRYQRDKLISTIVLANLKPINTYPYYTKPQDFAASIYCRKSPNSNNLELQTHCYSTFTEIYNRDVIKNILITLISQIMTLQTVVDGQKDDMEELILQDVEIAIVDQVAEPSAYDNCLSLCKVILKNFKTEAGPVVVAMLNELGQLRQQGDKGKRIINNLLDIVLFLPQVASDQELPLGQVQEILSMLYEQKQFKYLSRIIRKYHQFFDTKVQRMCLDLLVQIVSSPINDINNSEVVYQSALALKTILAETYEFDGISVDILMPCMNNILTIMKNKQFVSNPTLLWPVINLIIKLVSSLLESASTESLAVVVVNGLSSLLSSQKNQQLIVCALSQLMACLLHLVFIRIKEQCPLQGEQPSNNGAQKISPSTFVVFEGACVLVKMNIANHALQNYDSIYRLWLALLRHYPTFQQQSLYKFNLHALNNELKSLFQSYHVQVLEDSSVLFLQILEEMFLIGLWPLSEEKVSELIVKYLQQEEEQNKRLRIVLATVSLYLSYALTKNHIPQLVLYFLKELLAFRNKISPAINTLRCFLYLAIDHFIFTRSAGEVYQLFTNAIGGNFTEWFEPYLFSMQYVSSKQISKINSAGILKAISQIGVTNYAQMLVTPREDQYPMDWVLKTIYAKLDAVPQPTMYHEQSMYKTIIPNDFTPEFGIVKMRKIRLHFGNQLVKHILDQDLRPSFKERFLGIFGVLDWGVDDLHERVGYGTAVSISNLLGWQTPSFEH